ncbi:uncharacterized protein LOC135929937 isoform X2 [Gordionus sp. m RMFG-2023]|uniref:uncharacterized protein LOC135929937 isoform X2 n=1 Tax=Gordionus sp. m RMFG-2023 TaxID=3053472 RepID=UPI0031FD151D
MNISLPLTDSNASIKGQKDNSKLSDSPDDGEPKKRSKKKINVPEQLPIMLEQIAKASLINQPKDVYTFTKHFLDVYIANREQGSFFTNQQYYELGSYLKNDTILSPVSQESIINRYVLPTYTRHHDTNSDLPMTRSVESSEITEKIIPTKLISPSLREKGESLDSGLSKSHDFAAKIGDDTHQPSNLDSESFQSYCKSTPTLDHSLVLNRYEFKESANLNKALDSEKRQQDMNIDESQLCDSYKDIQCENIINVDSDKGDINMIFSDTYPMGLSRRKSSGGTMESNFEISSENGQVCYVPEIEQHLDLKNLSSERYLNKIPRFNGNDRLLSQFGEDKGEYKNANDQSGTKSNMPLVENEKPTYNNYDRKSIQKIENMANPLGRDSLSFEISRYTQEESSSEDSQGENIQRDLLADDVSADAFNQGFTKYEEDETFFDDSKKPFTEEYISLNLKSVNKRDANLTGHDIKLPSTIDSVDKHRSVYRRLSPQSSESDKSETAEENTTFNTKQDTKFLSEQCKSPMELLENTPVGSPTKMRSPSKNSDKFQTDILHSSRDSQSQHKKGNYFFDNFGFKDSLDLIDTTKEINQESIDRKINNIDIKDKDNFSRYTNDENIAATLIQSLYKGYRTRKELFGDNKDNNDKYPIDNMNIVDNTVAIDSNRKEKESISDQSMIDQAAARIQAMIKGYLTRKDVKDFLTTLPADDHRFDILKKDLLQDASNKANSVRAHRLSKSLSENSFESNDKASVEPGKSYRQDSHGSKESLPKPENRINDSIKQYQNIKAPEMDDYEKQDEQSSNFDYPDFLDSAASVIQSAFKSFLTKKRKSLAEPISPVASTSSPSTPSNILNEYMESQSNNIKSNLNPPFIKQNSRTNEDVTLL